MPKGNLNPADAYRKAQRKKELKKNKTDRHKARDLAIVKKDTTDLEDEIKSLEEKENPSAADKSRLAQIKSELEKINAKKEEYVKEHPEQRNLVYRRKRTEEEKANEKALPEQRNVFNKKGLPRHPERSIYYDPIMNPYGVPPPGMPYIERPLLPGEVGFDKNGDDVAMPNGPRPGPNEELVDSDDDIPMPDGPPPMPPLPYRAVTAEKSFLPPLPAPSLHNVLPLPPPLPSSAAAPFAPTLGFAGAVPPPPPPPGFEIPHAFPNFPPTGIPALPPAAAPPGFFPYRSQSISSMQDPLSSVPHTTYQAHRETRTPLTPHPSLPAKPVLTAPAPSATISAEPQLRDLKKEATSFVPTALKRKRGAAPTALATKVDAAPAVVGSDEGDTAEPRPARPDLVGMLRDQFGPPPIPDTKDLTKKDDYEKFMEEMGDILGS